MFYEHYVCKNCENEWIVTEPVGHYWICDECGSEDTVTVEENNPEE